MTLQFIFYAALTLVFVTCSPTLHAMEASKKSLMDCMISKDRKTFTTLLKQDNVNKEYEIKIHGEHKLAGEILRCKPIHCAVISNWGEIISNLANIGADINEAIYVPSLEISLTPLGLAIYCNYSDVVIALLESKAMVTNAGYFTRITGVANRVGYKNETINALHFACEFCCIHDNDDAFKIVKILLSKEIDINAVCLSRFRSGMFAPYDYTTALAIAYERDDKELIKLLKERGASQVSIQREIKDDPSCTMF